jgi:hypothetical protein
MKAKKAKKKATIHLPGKGNVAPKKTRPAKKKIEPKKKAPRAIGARGPALLILGDKMPAEIFGKYKGKEYTAIVTAAGTIKVDLGNVEIGEEYNSPSLAAMAITGKPVNGWTFWKSRGRPQDPDPDRGAAPRAPGGRK